MLLYVLELLAGCCVLMPYLRDCCFYSRSPVHSQDNGVAMWLLCSSQLIVEVLVKFHWEFGFENSVGVPRHDPHLNFQSYVVFVEWSAHRQMSHNCDARQCDSIHCNRTTCDSRFPRIREGHPAGAPLPHPIKQFETLRSCLDYCAHFHQWLFGTVQLFFTSAARELMCWVILKIKSKDRKCSSANWLYSDVEP